MKPHLSTSGSPGTSPTSGAKSRKMGTITMWNMLYGFDMAIYFMLAVFFGALGPNVLLLTVFVALQGQFMAQAFTIIIGAYAVYILTRHFLLRFGRSLHV